MVLPPHLLNLQEKLTSMNLPKMPIQSSPPKTQTQMQSESQFTNQSKNTFNIKNEKHSFINTKFNKKWKTLRKAAGVIWEDSTLDEWPDNDYRIFCGDLGNEVSDQILANAFSKYQSLKKAKVIRDKNTGKSKGYGFVSLLDVNDYISAMREMNGKYVGNRPIKIKRSTWKDRSILYSKSKIETVKFKKKKQKLIQKQNKMQFNNNNNTISDNSGVVVNNNNMSSSNNNLN